MNRYEFIVRDEQGEVLFAADKPSLDLLEEEIGRYKRLDKEHEN